MLLVAGAWLWIVPEPDLQVESDRIQAMSFASQVIEEHNANSPRNVQAMSDMDPRDRAEAGSAVMARHTAQYRAIKTRIYAAALAHVAAVCCWITATMSVLVRTRRTRREWARRVAAGLEEKRVSPAAPELHARVAGQVRRLTASSF